LAKPSLSGAAALLCAARRRQIANAPPSRGVEVGATPRKVAIRIDATLRHPISQAPAWSALRHPISQAPAWSALRCHGTVEPRSWQDHRARFECSDGLDERPTVTPAGLQLSQGGVDPTGGDGRLLRLASDSAGRCLRAYERIAPVYDLLDAAYEWSWKRRLREQLLRHAHGRILDVGIGTGCNLPFYPPGAEVMGVDLSGRMLQRARERARELDRPVQLAQMNLLDLAFPDQRFDTVLATFVLLCLPAELQAPALRELRRVCRPGGAVLLLDYRMSSNPGLRIAMRCLSPWLRWAFAGSYDAGTERHLERAGLRPAHRHSVLHDSAMLLVLKPVT
jgi:phosphatidylethanolamine/phosphatidyl-N-methylethanolamine N-methyltransferase